MYKEEPTPTPYHHKSPMRLKSYDIFYNLDYDLSKIKLNKHSYYEFYFLLSGSVTYYIEGRKYSLESGDIVLISPDQEHQAYIDNSKNVPYERYVLWLSPSYVDLLSSERTNLSFIFQAFHIANQQIRLSKDSLHHVKDLLKSIFINSKSQNYGYDLLADAYITKLLVHLAQLSLFGSNSLIDYQPTEPLSKEFLLTLKVLKYIEDHIYEPITIKDICDHCFVSRSYLSKTFSTKLGLPLYQYIVKKKLFLAKQDIANGLAIQEVSEKYGFGNYSSFYRAFCKEFGQNPQNFKQTENP